MVYRFMLQFRNAINFTAYSLLLSIRQVHSKVNNIYVFTQIINILRNSLYLRGVLLRFVTAQRRKGEGIKNYFT